MKVKWQFSILFKHLTIQQWKMWKAEALDFLWLGWPASVPGHNLKYMVKISHSGTSTENQNDVVNYSSSLNGGMNIWDHTPKTPAGVLACVIRA